MGIKWADVRILNSPLTNQIVLGKVIYPKDMVRGGCIATDKSKDKTDEILSCVMKYMDTWADDNNCKGMEIKNERGSLTWRKPKGDN
jgi:hypothetical protein